MTVHSSPSATTATEPSISNVLITPVLYAQNAPPLPLASSTCAYHAIAIHAGRSSRTLGAIGEHPKEEQEQEEDDSDAPPNTHELVLPRIHSNVEMEAKECEESESPRNQHAGPTLTLCSIPGHHHVSKRSTLFSECASSEETLTQDLDYDYAGQLQLDFSTERQVVIPSIFIQTESAESTPGTESSGYVSNSMLSPRHLKPYHVQSTPLPPPPQRQRQKLSRCDRMARDDAADCADCAEEQISDPTLSVINDHALSLTNSQNDATMQPTPDDCACDDDNRNNNGRRRVSVSSVNSVVSMPSQSSAKTVCITRIDDKGQATHSGGVSRDSRHYATATKTTEHETDEEDDGDMDGFIELVIDDDDDASMNLMTRDCSDSCTVHQLIRSVDVPSEVEKKEILKCRSLVLTDMMVDDGWTDRSLLQSLQNLRHFSG
eukprot:CAMPEP_0202687958 /NCGR_PEP_ID=MMETSP1385-20130828/3501_1 /ASSEMBLY_ACC=CAM_ASM_000861 /TAXON_ID=933848 /ORGANISM="Elphidium margaritaceum" /LENGTH=432 /DNA_ID=CAMNT_0049342823 /DNA_START=1040 /DNA_END=2338 /DNA_ORIENTATION=-